MRQRQTIRGSVLSPPALSPGEGPQDHQQTIMIGRDEWRFVAVVTLLTLALTTLPYLFGVLTSPPDRQFMGFMLDVPDHGQYLAWYKSFQSSLLVPNKLTPEPNDPIFFNLLWFALGRIGALIGWGYALIYQLFRLAASAFFLVTLYVFCALMMDRPSWRRTAFTIISLGSGLGWIWVIHKYISRLGDVIYPLDLYVAEGNSFLSILGYPHFIAAAGLILCVFILLFLGARRAQLRYAVMAGAIALILGWQHAYDLLILYGVPGVYTVLLAIRQRRLPAYWVPALFIMGIMSVWPALYSVWLTTADPLWEAVLDQFVNAGVFTPDPLHLLILMGLPLITALVALILRWRQRDAAVEKPPRSFTKPACPESGRGAEGPRPEPRHELAEGPAEGPLRQDAELFILTWFVVGFLLNYVPTDFQIHMLNSWQVPVGLLATWGLYYHIIPTLTTRLGRPAHLLPALFVLLSLPTNLYLLTWRFVDLQRHDYPFYLSRDEVTALHWLDANSVPDDIVLSSLTVGQYVPGIAGNTAFLAHWAQTVDFYTKEKIVTNFFDPASDDTWRQRVLDDYDVAFVFHGPAERALGAFAPSAVDYLQPSFVTDEVAVWRVVPHGTTFLGAPD
jgi:hypothetical protein